MNSKLIFITGGHATPAIACIDELKSRGYDNIIYIGQKKSLLFDKNVSSEYRIINDVLKIDFKPIIAGKLSLFMNFSSLIWLLRLPIGFIQAFWWTLILRPKLVLTFGSHVGVPVVFAACVFRIPILAHEQTTSIGRANKIIQKYATKVCLSWPETFKEEGDKFVLTGNPVRKEIFEGSERDFGFEIKNKKILFITGGNQGAHVINEFIFGALPKLVLKYNVLHQTGSNSIFNDYEKALDLSEKVNKSGVVYIPKDYVFSEEMASVLFNANIIISRAGANTVTEILVLKKKALFIPITTSSGNEQFLNAQNLEKLGLAKSLNQDDLEKTDLIALLEEIENQKEDHEAIDELALVHKEAQKRIIDEVEKIMK